MAVEGHSMGELAMSHRPLVSRVGNLAMASDERGSWPPYVGELWDVDTTSHSESVSTVGHEV